MMRLKTLIPPLAGLVGLLIAARSPAQAQPDPPAPPTASPADAPPAVAAIDPTLVTAGQAPPAQVQALASGDNRLVTNGPVPDTAANRAKFGPPLSHAGKKTAPTGN
jgi:hypothetical protein